MSGDDPLSEAQVIAFLRIQCDLYAERTTTAEKSCKALAAALEAMLNRPSLKLLDPKLLSNSWLVNAQSALTDYRKVNPR